MDKLISIYIYSIILHALMVLIVLFLVIRPSFFKIRLELPSNNFFYGILFLECFWLGGLTYLVRILNGLILYL